MTAPQTITNLYSSATRAPASIGWERNLLDSLFPLVLALSPSTKSSRAHIEALEEVIGLANTPQLSPRQLQAYCFLCLHLMAEAIPEEAPDTTHALLEAAQDLVERAQPLDFISRPVDLAEPLAKLLRLRQFQQPADSAHSPRQDLLYAVLDREEPALRDALLILTSEGPSPPLASWLAKSPTTSQAQEESPGKSLLPPPTNAAPLSESAEIELESSKAKFSNAMLVQVVSGAVGAAVSAVETSRSAVAKPTLFSQDREEVSAFKRLNPNRLPTLVPREFLGDLCGSSTERTWGFPSRPSSFYSRYRRWLQAAAILAFAAVAHLLVELSLILPSSATAKQTAHPGEERLLIAALTNAAAKPTLEPSEAIAERFLHATDLEDRIALLRDPRHAGLLRDHFLRMETEQLETEIEALNPLSPVRAGDLIYERFHVQFTDGRNRLLSVVEEKTGAYVDWGTYARQGSASWEEIIEASVTEAEVRVFVRRSDYYAAPFDDAERYQAYAITSPDLEETLYAYVCKTLD